MAFDDSLSQRAPGLAPHITWHCAAAQESMPSYVRGMIKGRDALRNRPFYRAAKIAFIIAPLGKISKRATVGFKENR